MTFWDRRDAGRRLAALVGRFAAQAPVVVAIPRGGVPVALEVARALSAPLEAVVVKKIFAPGRPEIGIGAVAEQGIFSVDPNALRLQHVSRHELEVSAQREYSSLMRALPLYRGTRGLPRIAGRTVLVVDDYVASGNVARAAAGALRDLRPRRLVLAAPLIAEAAGAALQSDYDELVCELEPSDAPLRADAWYERFPPISDADALAMFGSARAFAAPITPA